MVGIDQNQLETITPSRREVRLARERTEKLTAFIISLHSYGLSLAILLLCLLMSAPWYKVSVSFVLALATASLNTCLTCLGQALNGANALERAIGAAETNPNLSNSDVHVIEDSMHEAAMLRVKYGISSAVTVIAWMFVAVIFAIEQGNAVPAFREFQFYYHVGMIALALTATGLGLNKLYARRNMRSKTEKLVDKLRRIGDQRTGGK